MRFLWAANMRVKKCNNGVGGCGFIHSGVGCPPLWVHKNKRHVLLAEKIDALHTEERRVFVAVGATHFSPPL
jgi:hypothetical protein